MTSGTQRKCVKGGFFGPVGFLPLLLYLPIAATVPRHERVEVLWFLESLEIDAQIMCGHASRPRDLVSSEKLSGKLMHSFSCH